MSESLFTAVSATPDDSSLGVAARALVAQENDSVAYRDSAVEPITLDQAKKHLRVDLSDDDDYISSLITAARQMAEGRLNRTIMQRQIVAVFDNWMSDLRLLKPPLVSVDSLEYLDENGESQVIDSTSYRILNSTEPARVWLGYGFSAPYLYPQGQAITITYTAGYADGEVPKPIIQWMLLVIGSLYENRETMSAGVQIYDMPDNFMSLLLQPYMVYE